MDNNNQDFNQYNNSQNAPAYMYGISPKTSPYVGYYSVNCPRCGSVSQTMICSNCGLNLSKEYTVTTVPNGVVDTATGEQGFSVYINRAVKKKNRTVMIVGLIIGGIVLFVLLLAVAGYSIFSGSYSSGNQIPGIDSSEEYNFGTQSNNSSYAPGISRSEYSKITKGMTYAQVSAIAGGDGTIKSYNEKTGETVMLWASEEDQTLGYYITFVKNMVSDIKISNVED